MVDGAAVGFVVGLLHARISALMKLFLLAGHVVELDDRDRHDDSSASQAEHDEQTVAPGFEN